jgi:hypothetical protein
VSSIEKLYCPLCDHVVEFSIEDKKETIETIGIENPFAGFEFFGDVEDLDVT